MQIINNYHEQVEVTPEMAKEFLEKNLVNRKVNKTRVSYYANQMKNGQWVDNGEAICFGKNGDLVNGQHRLYAVIEAGVPVKLNIRTNVDEKSFATYDCGMNRTLGQVFSMAQIKNGWGVCSGISIYFYLLRHMKGAGSNYSYNVSRQDYLDEYNSSPEAYNCLTLCARRLYNYERLLPVGDIVGFTAYLVKELGYEEAFVLNFFECLCTDKTCPNNGTMALMKSRLRRDATGALKMDRTYRRMLLIKTWNCYATGKTTAVLKWNPEKEKDLWFVPANKSQANSRLTGGQFEYAY